MYGMHGAADADPARRGVGANAAIDSAPAAREREADKWIAQRLRDVGYDLASTEAQLLADHLQARGIGTLINMKSSNKLLSACEKRVMCKLPPPPKSWHSESERLIIISVRTAIPRFITQSMRTWDPEQSAIDTYFVNYCLFEFKRVYLQYHREESQGLVEHPTDNVIDIFDKATEGSVEDLVIARQTIREAVKFMDSPEFAEFVLLTANGLTRKQIAKVQGISLSSLDRRVSEYRRKLARGGWSIRKGR